MRFYLKKRKKSLGKLMLLPIGESKDITVNQLPTAEIARLVVAFPPSLIQRLSAQLTSLLV